MVLEKKSVFLCYCSILATAQSAFVTSKLSSVSRPLSGRALNVAVPAVWNAGNAFGKGGFRFYQGFEEWMKPFPDEDREKFPGEYHYSTTDSDSSPVHSYCIFFWIYRIVFQVYVRNFNVSS